MYMHRLQCVCHTHSWSQTLVSITAGNSIGASAKPLSDDITGETDTAECLSIKS